jgi:hypothetical protein
LITAIGLLPIALGAAGAQRPKPNLRAVTERTTAPIQAAANPIPGASRSGEGTLEPRLEKRATGEPAQGPARTRPTRRRAAPPVREPRPEPLQGPRLDRVQSTSTLAKPTVPSTGDDLTVAIGGNPLAKSSSNDLVVFRNTVVNTSNSKAVEPNAANDRNGIIATGNLYAAVSSDNGLTFSSTVVSPYDGELYGGACCDQVAYAVDRGSYSLVFWLVQDWYSASAERDALRLHFFKGRSDLLAGDDECNWTFEPSDFDLDSETWFDFNQMSHTDKYLYITTNVRDADKAPNPSNPRNDPRVGGLIFRIALDDIDDGNCQITYRYWYEHGNPYITPVQNAGATMHLATRVYDSREGDNLRIYSIRDLSNALEHEDKDIENYTDKNGHCPLPDGNDPCEGQHDGRMTGFRVGSSIGWLWMADEDGEFPFPHVRVAVFETGSKDKVLEHQIWNEDFAWQLPSVGVNSEGHLGVILYAMGGGRFPKPQAFIRTDPRDWSGIQMTGLGNSTSGFDDWGHFGSVRPYGNCAQSFLGSAYTSNSGQQEGRFIWFGLEGTGCADLVATSVSPPSGTFESGAIVDIATTVQNQGSAAAPLSRLGLYLSTDKSLDDGDQSFPTTRPTSALDPVAIHSLDAAVALPSVSHVTARDYYVIACADDLESVAEVTDTNNCVVSSGTLELKAKLTKEQASIP